MKTFTSLEFLCIFLRSKYPGCDFHFFIPAWGGPEFQIDMRKNGTTIGTVDCSCANGIWSVKL